MAKSAVLTVDGKTFELPIIEGTEGERAIDISTLREKSGLLTYDPSMGNTAVCRSSITYVDGEKGILRYRGIPIEQFVTAKPNFVEVAWLLIFGRLPRKEELQHFSSLLTENELLHQSLANSFDHIPVDAPPMAILSATLNNLAYYHQELLKVDDAESLEDAAARLISKVRTIAAFSYRRSRGLPFIYPDPKLRYCANLLHMMFSLPYRQYEILPEIEDAMNLVFILHHLMPPHRPEQRNEESSWAERTWSFCTRQACTIFVSTRSCMDPSATWCRQHRSSRCILSDSPPWPSTSSGTGCVSAL